MMPGSMMRLSEIAVGRCPGGAATAAQVSELAAARERAAGALVPTSEALLRLAAAGAAR